MMKRIKRSVLLLLVFAVLAGCASATQLEPEPAPLSPAPDQSVRPLPETDPPKPVEPEPTVSPEPEPDPIAEQLAGLTLEQKVGQLLVAGFEGTTAGKDVVRDVTEYQVGGLILFGRNVSDAAQLTTLINSLKELNGDHVPMFLSTDEEGGTISRVPTAVERLPVAYRFGQIADPDKKLDACFLFGQALAARCAAFGLNMSFAPVMDIWSNPNNTVIGRRAFGTTVEQVTYPANETAWGMMTGGVIPAAKHFPGHGDTAVDSHYGLPVVNKSLEELREMELVPFQRAIDGTCVYGAAAGDSAIPVIMVGHILMTAIDPDRPSSLSPAVVTGLLREEMGFEGVICTDGMTMEAVTDNFELGEAVVMAVEAGCDVVLVCHGPNNVATAYEALLEAARSGRISEERLDESVYRILALKDQFGLNNEPVETKVDIAALNAQVAEVKAAMK